VKTVHRWVIMAVLLVTGLVIGHLWLAEDLSHRRVEWRTRASENQEKARARFLQRLWRAAGGKAGFEDARRVKAELERMLVRGNPYGREYSVVTLDGRTYVLEVPRDRLESVCILFPDGYVEFALPSSPLLHRLVDSLNGATNRGT